MNKIFYITLCLFCLSGVSYADLYVVVDKNTNEVITVSEKDDTVLEANQELKKIKGELSDFTGENPINYKLKDGKFIKNIDKIDKSERLKEEIRNNIKIEELIQSKIREMAISELKKDGKLNDNGKIIK